MRSQGSTTSCRPDFPAHQGPSYCPGESVEATGPAARGSLPTCPTSRSAAPNEAAADAGERIARAGGNAVDAALAAALVTMVNEVGLVSLSSGGFITVQPPDGSAPQTVDGWMDMPGRGRAARRRHLGRRHRVRRRGHDHGRARLGRDPRLGGGLRGSAPAVGQPAVARPRDSRDRGRAGRVPAQLGLHATTSGTCTTTIFGWDDQSRSAVHDADGALQTGSIVMPDLAASLELIAADGAERAAHRRAGAADQRRRDRPRRHPRRRGPRGLPARRASGADQHAGRLDVRDEPAAVGGRRLRHRDAAAARRESPPALGRQRRRAPDPGAARRARPPARRARQHRRPGPGGRSLPRPHRPRPPRGAGVRLDRARLGHRQRRRGVLGHDVLGLQLGHDRAGHRHLAQQLPRRAGAQRRAGCTGWPPAPGCCPTWRRRSGTTRRLGARDRLAGRRPDHDRDRAGARRVRQRRPRPAAGDRPPAGARASSRTCRRGRQDRDRPDDVLRRGRRRDAARVHGRHAGRRGRSAPRRRSPDRPPCRLRRARDLV